MCACSNAHMFGIQKPFLHQPAQQPAQLRVLLAAVHRGSDAATNDIPQRLRRDTQINQARENLVDVFGVIELLNDRHNLK